MRGVGIDWSGQVSRVARGSRRSLRSSTSSSGAGGGERLLPYSVTTGIWIVIAVACLFTSTRGWLMTFFILGMLRIRHDHYHDDSESFSVEVIPEQAFDTVSFSVYQGAEGPTVSTITNGGDIFTKVFPSWPTASAHVTKTKAKYEADGIAVKFLTEPI